MKVTPEIVTVWAEPDSDTVNIVLAGLRITLEVDEAVLLAGALARGLERLRSNAPRAEETAHMERFAERPGEAAAVIVRKDPPAAAASAEIEAMQLRTRALVQASIRDKGLSLREEPGP